MWHVYLKWTVFTGDEEMGLTYSDLASCEERFPRDSVNYITFVMLCVKV
jgi:hypothetical protein